jgi:nucleotidyltransferase/DNA polymerase involved in DNA repair
MRIACIIVHNLAIQVATACDPSVRGQALVIGGVPFEAKPVYDASPEAIACGVKIGMPLREAYALCPEAKFLASDETKYEQAFEEVANVLEKFSPVVDIEKPGCAYMDISGLRDEANLCREVLQQISGETGLSACLGVSGGKFFSRVAALTSKPAMPVIVSPGEEKDFVAAFSVSFFPCSEETKGRLRLLGIRFIGELTQFSRESLVAQFGGEGRLMHDLAHGIDRSPLVPRAKPETISDSIRFDCPAVSLIEILQACEIMLGNLLRRVNEQGRLCREATLRLGFISAMQEERKLALKEATTSTGAILGRLQTWLETVRFPSPVTQVGLSLSLTNEQSKKLSLWPQKHRASRELMRTAEELRLRFGYQPIKKSRVVSPKPILPERQFVLTDVLE